MRKTFIKNIQKADTPSIFNSNVHSKHPILSICHRAESTHPPMLAIIPALQGCSDSQKARERDRFQRPGRLKQWALADSSSADQPEAIWTQENFFICCVIQGTKDCTRAYTPGMSAQAQPMPQLTTPTKFQEPATLQTRGPPESP